MVSVRYHIRVSTARSKCDLGERVSFCSEVVVLRTHSHGAIQMLFRSMWVAFCRPILEFVMCCHSLEESHRQRNCQRQVLLSLFGSLLSKICRQIGSASMGIGSSACRYGFAACRKPTQRLVVVLLLVPTPSKGTKKRNRFPSRRLPMV